MMNGGYGRVARCAQVVAFALALVGLGGCSLMTPPLSEAEVATVDQVVDDAALVTPGTLTVALDTNDAPQAMMTSDGVEGYEVDVASALAHVMGLDLEIVSATSPEDPLTEGEADLFLGATTDDASKEIVVLGDCLENATAIFGNQEGSSTTLTADELSQATIGVQESSASQEMLAQAGIVSAQETFSNVNECFDALAAGEVDYVACDATAGAYLARAYPGVGFMGTLSTVTAHGVALASGASELIDAVSTAVDELSSDGTLGAIHATWYGTMPFSLSDQTISGVTITTTEDDESPSGDLNSMDE